MIDPLYEASEAGGEGRLCPSETAICDRPRLADHVITHGDADAHPRWWIK
jgi:hypothetical protein